MSELKTSVLIMHQNMLFSKSKQFHTAADGASSNKSHPCVIHTLTSILYLTIGAKERHIAAMY